MISQQQMLTAFNLLQIWTFPLVPQQLDVLVSDGPILVSQVFDQHTVRRSGGSTMFYPVLVSFWTDQYRLWLPQALESILVLVFPSEADPEQCLYPDLTSDIASWHPTRYVIPQASRLNVTCESYYLPSGLSLRVRWTCEEGVVGGFVLGHTEGNSWALPLTPQVSTGVFSDGWMDRQLD